MILEAAIILACALFVGGATAFILMKMDIDAGRRGKTAYARWLNARYVRKFDEQLTDALVAEEELDQDRIREILGDPA